MPVASIVRTSLPFDVGDDAAVGVDADVLHDAVDAVGRVVDPAARYPHHGVGTLWTIVEQSPGTDGVALERCRLMRRRVICARAVAGTPCRASWPRPR